MRRLSETQLSELGSQLKLLPDTLDLRKAGIKMNPLYLAEVRCKIYNSDHVPVTGEKIFIRLRKYKKVLCAVTDEKGYAEMALPKGDTMDLHFTYDKCFRVLFFYPSIFENITDLDLVYIGSAAIAKMMKEREERMRIRKEQLERERKAFEERMKAARLSEEAARKKELETYMSSAHRNAGAAVVSKVLSRNKAWKRKLIVCDVTGSMSPYAAELCVWYKLNHQNEKSMQLVFFNDGNDMEDSKKLPGKTGGIYCYKSTTYEQMLKDMAFVIAKGDGGNVPENNIEALNKAIEYGAGNFDEVIMIADNEAPVSDMELLRTLRVPVRIVLCGVRDQVETDYIKIAHATGGSVHTIEEDIFNVARTMEGQSIRINGLDYRLMNGRFMQVKKL
jgi:hypothetical protein